MYSEITRSIKVSVEPFYLEDQSSPAESRYVWAYHVRIENRGRETVRLRNRHWKITDNRGQMQEVRGPGVVGEQPVLGPGEAFEYTSGTPLPTPSGIMIGYLRDGNEGRRELLGSDPRLFARQPASAGPAQLTPEPRGPDFAAARPRI